MKTYLMILGLVICIPVLCSGAVIHVPGEQPTIQAGIDAAIDGDTVLIENGTYTGWGNRDIDFNGKAITVTSQDGPENCVIDCRGTSEDPHRGFIFHTMEHRLTILQGFTIQNGFISGESYSANGAGINCEEASPTIKNCVFFNNQARSLGGGDILQGLFPEDCQLHV